MLFVFAQLADHLELAVTHNSELFLPARVQKLKLASETESILCAMVANRPVDEIVNGKAFSRLGGAGR